MPECSPKPSHRARFQVFGPQPSPPPLVFANAQPRDRDCIVRATPPPPTTFLHRRFTRQIRNRATAARFWVLGPSPLPRFAFVNARGCRRLVRTTPLPPATCHHRFLTWKTRNRVTAALFRVVSPKHLPPACAIERPHKPPQPPHIPQPTTFSHRPPLPFPTALPKPSPSDSVSDFGPKPAASACASEHSTPAMPPPVHTHTHHFAPSSPITVSISTPKTEHHRLGFRNFGPGPFSF